MVTKRVERGNPEWKWIRSYPGDPDLDGNIGRMYGSETSEPPKSLKSLFPEYTESSVRACMFVREAVANSWDAFSTSIHGHDDFELHFRFRTLSLLETRNLAKVLDLGNLRQRIDDVGPTRAHARRTLGLTEIDCLSDLTLPIRVLEVSERWGGGMGGAWNAGDSAMERALIKVGRAQQNQEAGGSYGYGKAAVAQGSNIISVIAYSCFPPSENDPVTRRLLGATYWGEHNTAAGTGKPGFRGWALFGDHSGAHTRALEDSAADEVASKIGLAPRQSGVDEDFGTSFLFVDPSFSRADLEAALLCFWWPALLQTRSRRLHVFVSDDESPASEIKIDGEHPQLGPFVRTYKAAESLLEESKEPHADPHVDEELGLEVSQLVVDGGVAAAVGLLETSEPGVAGESLVAIMRSHRMVICYERATGTPVTRGVLLAADSSNRALRLTEPPEHHFWRKKKAKAGDPGEPEDYRFAKVLLAEFTARWAEFRRARSPKVEARRGWTPSFSGFLGVPGEAKKGTRVDPGEKKEKKKRPEREVYVHLVHPDDFHEVERPTRQAGQSADTLQALATVEFGIVDTERNPELEVEFELKCRVSEEGGSGEPLAITVDPVKGSVDVREIENGDRGHARFYGVLRNSKKARFTVVTDDYSNEWTVDLTFNAIVTKKTDGVNDGK